MPFRPRQNGFRFRPDDDVTLASATWNVALNTNISRSVDTVFRVRFLIQEAGGTAGNCVCNLYYSLNSGTYAEVTASTPVKHVLSGQFADGDTISSGQLGGSGSFATGYGIESITNRTVSLPADGYSEVEYSLQLDSAQIANGDTIDLQVRNNTSTLNQYNQTPRITAIEASPTRAQVSFAELEVPTALNRAFVSWAELEVPDYVPATPTRAQVSWAELETPNAPTRGLVSWAELEVPTALTRALVSWAEFEVPQLPTRGQVSWAEFEIPQLLTRALVTWAEFEVPDKLTRGLISWAVFELGESPTRAQISWAELEAPTANTRALISWAEMEIPDIATRALISWGEFEVPTKPTRANVSWAELEIPIAATRALISWAQMDVPPAPTRALVAWAELMVIENGDIPVGWCALTGVTGVSGGSEIERLQQ